MTPPADKAFLVKYKLVPIPGETQSSVQIDGNFSYSQDDKTKVESIREMELNIDAMDADQRPGWSTSGTPRPEADRPDRAQSSGEDH